MLYIYRLRALEKGKSLLSFKKFKTVIHTFTLLQLPVFGTQPFVLISNGSKCDSKTWTY